MTPKTEIVAQAVASICAELRRPGPSRGIAVGRPSRRAPRHTRPWKCGDEEEKADIQGRDGSGVDWAEDW